jgi:hypothetical protein
MTTQAATRWELAGEYFENCNCDVVCPCEISPKGGLQARPTQGTCDVFLAFHINEGRYGDVRLDGLNVVAVFHTPGPMAEGNWIAAAYLDERASADQQAALGAIFGGAAGGPPAALAALISDMRAPKVVPIAYESEGKRRRVQIPDILDAEVVAVPGGGNPDEPVVKRNAHPLFPELTQAYGVRAIYTDHGMRWDNAGKNGDYAAFRWANS